MDKIALVLAVIGIAAGGYAVAAPLMAESEAEPATREALESLRREVATLRSALDGVSDARQAEKQARERAKLELTEAEAALAKQATRLDALEATKPADDGVLRTRELVIESETGQPLLRLGASSAGAGDIVVYAKTGKRAARLFGRDDDDGELVLFDHTGALRANIGGNDAGGYANFYGRDGGMAAYIGGDSAKPGGYIGVYGKDKQELVGIYTNPKGGVLSARSLETGKQIVMIGAAPNNGMGFVGLGTEKGEPALALFVTENGGQIKTLNAEGNAATFMGVSADPAGHGLMYVCRKNGKRIIEAGATTTRGGYMSMHNGADERILFMGSSSGDAADDGVLEVARKNGKLGVVLRAYASGSSVRVYDAKEAVKVNLR